MERTDNNESGSFVFFVSEGSNLFRQLSIQSTKLWSHSSFYATLKQIGLLGNRLALSWFSRRLRRDEISEEMSSENGREFWYDDEVYGLVKLPSYIRDVTAVEEFQRLKYLKQLGTSDAKYDGADHSRFEHSLGACYLAGRLLDSLSWTHTIDDGDRKCVLLAAVLHDVGHGPFSHTWEKFVGAYGERWKHEECSVKLVNRILRRATDLSDGEIALVCSLISGSASDLLTPDRRYLAQIVSADVDVDRCDYLQRDSYHVPNIIQPSRPFREIFERAKIVRVGDESLLAYDLRDYALVYEMAGARQELHRRCYEDPNVLAGELMVCDALHEAERAGFRFSRNGQCERLSKVHNNLELFMYLNDSIIEELLSSKLPGLEKTKEIITRYRKRNLYQQIMTSPVDLSEKINRYNQSQHEAVVRQAFRHIQSTKQWFGDFNVHFYTHNLAGAIVIVPAANAEEHVFVNGCQREFEDEVKEYIIYCTSSDSEVRRATKHHFMNADKATIES
ncbi:deoxynucleoside triphosphate triphosphohydrolase SAMHD1 homolog [Anopheles cruzii]|uniref:deoxynucleoside triphosphate triphosphohydrolase SAMHD1 homolog n=1 Tax=Anopheles cruzii TaxID=68878 RepID=UPI0022EC681A|nr:deoxynucleoside triphosphate triphosphohydrolase SAMHD1 homolog [Anopheles cruzii]